jgi:hypothetical protein
MQDVGRWVTIGAREGPDGKRHGGSPIYIQNGHITKGHPRLLGRKIAALEEEPEHSTHRQQLRQEFKNDLTGVLQEARRALGEYGSGKGINLRTARGQDATSIRGIDQVAEKLAGDHPAVLRRLLRCAGCRVARLGLPAKIGGALRLQLEKRTRLSLKKGTQLRRSRKFVGFEPRPLVFPLFSPFDGYVPRGASSGPRSRPSRRGPGPRAAFLLPIRFILTSADYSRELPP